MKRSFQFAFCSALEPLERRVLLAVGVLDTVVFGNTPSESSHALSQTQSQVIAGSLGQSARQLLPLSTVGVNGGSLTFTMTVDPVQRNYFSVKLWGEDDTDQGKGRLYLYIPSGGVDYQVGYRHEGDYMPLTATAASPPLSGRFFYSTTLLPLSMTQGLSSMTLKIQSTGELYALGSGGPPSGTYQFNMDTASRGIYRAYTHTAPYLEVSDETQGTAPATTTRPIPTESSVLGPSGTYTTGLNNWISGRLSAAITSFTCTDVELLARSYSVSQLSAGYQNPAIVSKVIAVIDGFTSDYYTNPGNVSDGDNYGANGGNEVWGGRFGALGWAIHLLATQLDSSLDTNVNYGSVGGNKTRRVAWGDMLRASRDYGRFNRDGKYLTNQALIADTNIYKANRAMIDIAASGAFTETAARRYLKEAIGLQPWLGSDLATGGSSNKYGTSYYQVTPDGLTKEWGVSGSYAEMQYFAATFYKYTNDTAFRAQAIKMLKARAYFRRPSIEISGANKYRSMEREGILAWRGVRESDGYFKNEMSYGDDAPWSQGMRVAAASINAANPAGDPFAIGYAKQMLADNQYFSQLIADSRFYSALTFDSRFAMEVYDDYNAVKAVADSNVRLPMTDGQPDSAFADEPDAIVAIKHGNERLWIEGLWQAKDGTGINGIGRFHYSAPDHDQFGTLETNPQFDFSGSYYVRLATLIDKPEPTVGQYNPPSPPTNAYGGEKLPIGNELGAHDNAPFRGRASYYAMRFGNYLMGINASFDRTFELKTPIGFASGSDLISGNDVSGTPSVAPGSTIALYLGSSVDPAPLPTAPLTLIASGTPAQVNLNWSAGSGATSYNVKRSPTHGGPYTTIASNVPAASFIDTNITRGTAYYYVVAGVNANGEGYNSGETLMSPGLPAPWANQDIGSVTLAGSAAKRPGGFTLSATGTAIGGTTDSFHFAYLPITGDVTIIARVSGMLNASGQDRAGVMVRESLNADSKMAAILFEDGGNVRLTRRTTTGGSAATSGSISSTWAPGWMKLERIGNSFAAYLSTDGVNWGSAFSTQTISMTAQVYVGLAAASRSQTITPAYNQTTAANFENVQILPGVTVTAASYPIDVRPDTVKFTFSADVGATLAASDLILARSDGGAVPAVQSVQWDAGTKTATFFLTPGTPDNGAYLAVLPAYSVATSAGQPLNSDYTLAFTFVLGDATKDGVVNSADFNAVASHFNQTGQTWSNGDFNYDGVVNALDFNALASNFGTNAGAAVAQNASIASGSVRSLFSDAHRLSDDRPIDQINL